MTRPALSRPSKGRKDSPAPRSGPAASSLPAWLPYTSLALAVLCLVGLFATQIADTDFWWHLKTGQYILQRYSLPVPDPFSYATSMNPPADPGEARILHFNLTHEWLAQAALYGVYIIGGLPGIILVRAVMLAAFCGLAGLLAARRSGNFYLGFAAALPAALVARLFTADRPALFTFLMAAVFVAVAEYRRFLWLLPALAVFWANCHSGFFLGWVVLLAYCAGTVRTGPQFAAPEDRRRLWLVTAVSIAVSGLNPNGFGIVATLIRYRQSPMTANLLEWSRPYLWGPPYTFDVLLYAAIAVLVFSWKRVRVSDWVLFVAFGSASLLAFRNIPLIGFLAPVLVASYLPFELRVPKAAGWLLPILLAGALITGMARGSFFQLHAASWKFPAGAADYLLQHHVDGPLFNTWEDGGYLIWRLWPQQRVFIDGRALSESLNRDYRQILYNLGSDTGQITGPRAELLQRYGIRVIVTNMFEYVSGAAYPLALALVAQNNSDWQLVYDDPHSLVFWRSPPAGTPVFADKVQRVLNHMDTECADYIEHDPELPQCARTLADYWMRGNNRDRAYRMLTLYLSHASQPDPEAEAALQQLLRSGR